MIVNLQEPYEDEDRFMIGSFPKGFGYPDDENDIHSNDVSDRALTGEVKPRILIMGLRRYENPLSDVTSLDSCSAEAANRRYRKSFSIRCHPTRPYFSRAPTK